MKIFSTYSVKIKSTEYKCVFKDTAAKYRKAVDFFIDVRMKERTLFDPVESTFEQLSIMERITVSTAAHPSPQYDFSAAFYKFPAYYRRAAINEALGKVGSYLLDPPGRPKCFRLGMKGA